MKVNRVLDDPSVPAFDPSAVEPSTCRIRDFGASRLKEYQPWYPLLFLAWAAILLQDAETVAIRRTIFLRNPSNYLKEQGFRSRRN
jgi:hypothetical protein